jgi:polyphosphate kinase
VITALVNAARNGKEVTVIFELQARFDEKANIKWSKKLQEVGAHVIFGVPGLKVHAKITLISRREKRKLVHYACVGTGNFHEGNASVYVDSTMLTCDPRITTEVRKVFDFFEHPFRRFSYKHLCVSPQYMRRKMNSLVENEIKNAKSGNKAP